MIRQLTTIAFTMACIQAAVSQDTDSLEIYDLSLEELSQLEIYATSRTETQNAAYSAANVTIITQEQIARRGYENLIDVLEDIPDFKIDRNVDPRWLHDVTLRGVRYMDKIIVLQDGIRISSPTNEIVPISHNYPIHYAQQIEIIKGPASALYGADAFAGVINIITRNKESEVSGTLSGGMYDTGTGNIFVSKRISKDFDFTIGGHAHIDQQPDLAKTYEGEYQGMDEELRTGTFNTLFGPISPSTPVDPNKAYPIESIAANAQIRYKNLTIGGFLNHIHVPSTTANSPHNSVYNEEQFFSHDIKMITGNYRFTFGKTLSSTQVTYNNYELDKKSNFRNVFTGMEPAFKYAYSRKLKAEQLFTISASETLKVTTGATIERFYSIPRSGDLQAPVSKNSLEDAIIVNSIASNNPGGIPAELIETRYTNIGALLQLGWSLTEWDIEIGGRFDRDDRFSSTFNPRLGVVYHPEGKNYILKGLYGRAYLAPSPQNIYDRFGTFNTDDGGLTYSTGFYHLPNEELKPQIVSSAEISAKVFLNENLSFDGALYGSEVTNQINAINSNDQSDRIASLYPNNEYEIDGVTYQIDEIEINDNLGESLIYGFTLSLNYQNPVGNISHAYINYGFIDGNIDIDEDGPIKKRNLPGIAQGTIQLGTTFRFGDLSIDSRLSILTHQHTVNPNSTKQSSPTKYQNVGSYHLLNVHLRYKVLEKMTLFVSGRNVTNQKYRNVNIGANPENSSAGGSAALEFANGAPQNPIRITGGITFKL